MYIHHNAKVIYLAHPRTASQATAAALQIVGFVRLPPPSDHHSQLWDEGTPVTPANRSDWTVFTTVRNPWDVAISWVFRRYRNRSKRIPPKWDMAAFNYALDTGNRWVVDDKFFSLHSEDADVIIRYESLQSDLNSVLTDNGIQSPFIAPLNVSRKREERDYRDFYTEETAEYIGRRFCSEIDRYEYKY